MSAPITDRGSLPQRLRNEADLCRSETATDIAALLDEAADALTASQKRVQELEAAEHERKQMSLPVNVRNAIGAATARGARE